MSRYIDADKLIEYAEKRKLQGIPIEVIKSKETADVEKVVRCKDCKFSKISIWRDGTSHYACGNSIYIVSPNDYCCRGEKKTDKENKE